MRPYSAAQTTAEARPDSAIRAASGPVSSALGPTRSSLCVAEMGPDELSGGLSPAPQTQENAELKAQPGEDLVLGRADLAAAFMRRDLIDEYQLHVHPIVIGQGKPLFPASDAKINLQLAETRTFGKRSRPLTLRVGKTRVARTL
jgi:hypothetical protein